MFISIAYGFGTNGVSWDLSFGGFVSISISTIFCPKFANIFFDERVRNLARLRRVSCEILLAKSGLDAKV